MPLLLVAILDQFSVSSLMSLFSILECSINNMPCKCCKDCYPAQGQPCGQMTLQIRTRRFPETVAREMVLLQRTWLGSSSEI